MSYKHKDRGFIRSCLSDSLLECLSPSPLSLSPFNLTSTVLPFSPPAPSFSLLVTSFLTLFISLSYIFVSQNVTALWSRETSANPPFLGRQKRIPAFRSQSFCTIKLITISMYTWRLPRVQRLIILSGKAWKLCSHLSSKTIPRIYFIRQLSWWSIRFFL